MGKVAPGASLLLTRSCRDRGFGWRKVEVKTTSMYVAGR